MNANSTQMFYTGLLANVLPFNVMSYEQIDIEKKKNIIVCDVKSCLQMLLLTACN